MTRDFPKRLAAAATALLIVLAAAGCATPDDRTVQERADDERVAHRIEAALAAKTYLDTDHVTIEVRRGVASLSGMIGDAEDLTSVLRACASVPGVLGVDDQLEIVDFTHDSGGSEAHVH